MHGFRVSIFLFFFACLIAPGFSADRSYQVQFFTIKVQNNLDYKRLEQIGIDTIIYRVFQDDRQSGGLYFENSRFRTLEPALESLIAEMGAKKTNLKLCAWMIGRKFKWIDNPQIQDYQYENGERQLVDKLDIFNPQVIQQLIEVFRQLASKKIQGILIQDDLTFRFNEGFSNWGKARFMGETNVPAREKLMMKRNTAYNKKWKQVKVEQIDKVVKVIVESCKRVNSGIKVGMNIYYETPVFTEKAEAWYAHNLQQLMNTGLDRIYLMSYHRQIKDEMKLSENKNRELFQKIVTQAFKVCKDKLIVKIQLRDWNTSKRIPVDEIKAYMQLIPPQVKTICFTPVTTNDYQYLEEILGKKK